MPSSLNIPFRPSGFGPGRWPELQKPAWLPLTMAELLRSAITVGKPGQFYRGRVRWHIAQEFAYRALMVAANLAPDAYGLLKRSDAFQLLDPSEKGAISYFLGLTTAKLFAERMLSTPWLLHLQLFPKSLSAKYWKLRHHKPDLVGRNERGEWVVVEAKGRSGQVPAGLLEAAKFQTRCLRSLNGELPALRVAVACGFPKDRLCVELCDPSEPAPEAVSIDLPIESFFEVYYAPVRQFIEEAESLSRRRIGEQEFTLAPLEGADLEIGVASRILGEPPERQVTEGVRTLAETRGEPLSVGADGIVCQFGSSWRSWGAV